MNLQKYIVCKLGDYRNHHKKRPVKPCLTGRSHNLDYRLMSFISFYLLLSPFIFLLSPFKKELINEDLVILDASGCTLFGTWQIFESGDGLYGAKVDDEKVWES